jgi:hypothetical protein
VRLDGGAQVARRDAQAEKLPALDDTRQPVQRIAFTRPSFEPKWYCTAELFPIPAAAPI